MRASSPWLQVAAALLMGARALATTTGDRTHNLRGEIVAIRPAHQTLLVHHEEIPGYMPAMTMEFSAPGADVTAFHEGERITARVTEIAPGAFRLENIRILDPKQEQFVSEAERALHQQTRNRGQHPSLDVGEALPEFALYDQDGRVVSAARFHGKCVVLNFIFTRCPVATMCPAATARMIALQRLAREHDIRDLELISITLDPDYDTPAVLKAYAAARGIDTTNFTFLTGPEGAIRDLLTQFRVVVLPDGNLFSHSLATVLIGRDGKLALYLDDVDWDPANLLKHL